MPIVEFRLPNARSTIAGTSCRGSRLPSRSLARRSGVGCDGLGRQQQLDLVEGGDELATGDQFFESRAILELFVVNETFPEVWSDCAEGGLTEEIEGCVHAQKF